jgi:predicted dinucleotide-binding enzyme
MRVGILGAGNVGTALTKASTGAGHSHTISAASREEAEKLVSEVGGTAAGSNREAVAYADLVILAVPFDAIEDIISELGGEIDGKVFIDVTNRFNPSELTGPSNAERTQQIAPNARVVKAFNTVFAAKQARSTSG